VRVSKRALDYLRREGISKLRLSLYFDCSIKIKIEVLERRDDVKDVELIVDEDAEPLLQGLMLDYDGVLFLRPEI